MNSKREKQRVWPAAGMLAISVLVHLTLLFLPLPGPRHETAKPDPTSLRVELVTRPSPTPTTDEVPPSPQPPEPAPVEPTEPAPSAATESAAHEEAPSDEPATDAASTAPAVATPEPAPEAIKAQLLGAARNLGRRSEQPKDGKGLEYQDIPELPSQRGWLHQYTGRVSTSIDRWRGNDGSRSARIVTGSGQVVCVRTRAPRMDEIFNPWMSSAIPMMHGCGRERPEGVDRSDPWLRSPGSGRGRKEGTRGGE